MLIDLSHTVEHGLETYRGLPAPTICDFLSREASRAHYAEGTECQIGRIEMIANTGHLPRQPVSSFRRWGGPLRSSPLEHSPHLTAILVRPGRDGRAIGPEVFEAVGVRRAVLVYTGWDQHWPHRGLFRRPPVSYSDPAAGAGRPGSGIRRGSTRSTSTTPRISAGRSTPRCLAPASPSASTCADWPALPASGAHFFAVPVKVRAFGTFPVRAFARV